MVDNSGAGPQRVGNYLSTVKVKLTSGGTALSGYYVIAAVDTSSSDSEYYKAFQDFTDLDRNPFLCISSNRVLSI